MIIYSGFDEKYASMRVWGAGGGYKCQFSVVKKFGHLSVVS